MRASTSRSRPSARRAFHIGDDAKARSLARRCNELSATLMQRHPDRFGGFAASRCRMWDGALKELEYALDVLTLDGRRDLLELLRWSILEMLASSRFSTSSTDAGRSCSFIRRPHRIRRLTVWGLPDSLIDLPHDHDPGPGPYALQQSVLRVRRM